jgi:hypothetical protein
VIEIRSYRRVFDLERRIYRIDRLRLNPGGIPVRGVVYLLVLLAVAALVGRVPGLATVMRTLPWYLRDVALPAGGAALLTVIRIEGRPFHLAARAMLRYRCGARCLAGARPRRRSGASRPGGCWSPPDILMLPDGSEGRSRRLCYTGPGAVLVAVAHERVSRSGGVLGLLGSRTALTIRTRPDAPRPPKGQVIVLRRAARVRVR